MSGPARSTMRQPRGHQAQRSWRSPGSSRRCCRRAGKTMGATSVAQRLLIPPATTKLLSSIISVSKRLQRPVRSPAAAGPILAGAEASQLVVMEAEGCGGSLIENLPCGNKKPAVHRVFLCRMPDVATRRAAARHWSQRIEADIAMVASTNRDGAYDSQRSLADCRAPLSCEWCWKIRPGLDWDQSGSQAPENLTTLPHFSVSSPMSWRN